MRLLYSCHSIGSSNQHRVTFFTIERGKIYVNLS
jgi:hypothetical protein